MNGEPAGLYCPGCGEHAQLSLPGQSDAFCGNESCHIIKWDTTQTVEELAANMNWIDLGRFFSGGTQ